MKKGIHPKYELTEVKCSGGFTLKTKSTVPNLEVEISAFNHPFYTGTQKLLDTAGRVERFNKRYGIKE